MGAELQCLHHFLTCSKEEALRARCRGKCLRSENERDATRTAHMAVRRAGEDSPPMWELQQLRAQRGVRGSAAMEGKGELCPPPQLGTCRQVGQLHWPIQGYVKGVFMGLWESSEIPGAEARLCRCPKTVPFLGEDSPPPCHCLVSPHGS